MNATNRTLLAIHQEIQQMQNSVNGLFHRSKIKQFYSDNGIRIDTIHKKMRELQSEYFVIENEQIKKGEDSKPIMQEGKDRKEFEDKFEILMNGETTIKI